MSSTQNANTQNAGTTKAPKAPKWSAIAEKGPALLDEVDTFHTELMECLREMGRAAVPAGEGEAAGGGRSPRQILVTYNRLARQWPKLSNRLGTFLAQAGPSFEQHAARAGQKGQKVAAGKGNGS